MSHPGPMRSWLAALRPQSLPIAVAPVCVGGAVAYLHIGHLPWDLLLMALAASLLMQLVTNLQNDVGYTRRGGEALGDRRGLPRATAEGWLGLGTVQWAVALASLTALLLGLGLVALRGWPVLALGSASLLAALAYMGGPKPIAYTPWGEFTVFVFFGLVAVLGTEWLLSDHVSLTGVLAACATGGTPAAALAINNHRDHLHDRAVGRHTFAVIWGEQASRRLVLGLLWAPQALSLVLAGTTHSAWFLLTWLLAPYTSRLYQAFTNSPAGLAYNRVLFGAFRLSLGYAALLAVAAVCTAVGAA